MSFRKKVILLGLTGAFLLLTTAPSQALASTIDSLLVGTAVVLQGIGHDRGYSENDKNDSQLIKELESFNRELGAKGIYVRKYKDVLTISIPLVNGQLPLTNNRSISLQEAQQIVQEIYNGDTTTARKHNLSKTDVFIILTTFDARSIVRNHPIYRAMLERLKSQFAEDGIVHDFSQEDDGYLDFIEAAAARKIITHSFQIKHFFIEVDDLGKIDSTDSVLQILPTYLQTVTIGAFQKVVDQESARPQRLVVIAGGRRETLSLNAPDLLEKFEKIVAQNGTVFEIQEKLESLLLATMPSLSFETRSYLDTRLTQMVKEGTLKTILSLNKLRSEQQDIVVWNQPREVPPVDIEKMDVDLKAAIVRNNQQAVVIGVAMGLSFGMLINWFLHPQFQQADYEMVYRAGTFVASSFFTYVMYRWLSHKSIIKYHKEIVADKIYIFKAKLAFEANKDPKIYRQAQNIIQMIDYYLQRLQWNLKSDQSLCSLFLERKE